MIIQNVLLADPSTKTLRKTDIRIANGLICEISESIAAAPEEEVIDASGLTAAPGLIDTHVHFRDPGFTYKENLHTGSLAAAKG